MPRTRARHAIPAVAAAVLLVLAALPAAATAQLPDPLQHGPHAVTHLLYDDGTEVVGGGSSTTYWPQAIRGSLHVPVAARRFPLIVLLHGRHQTCAVAGMEIVFPVPPCPTVDPAVASIDSYLGYEDLAGNLASHGYVVASIDANGDNGYDLSATDGGALARAQTIALNIDRLARWNGEDGPAPVEGALRGRVDLSRIGLMGHSRGGEGVSQFIAYNRERPEAGVASGPRYPGLRAVMALAPVDFLAQEPAGVAWGTLLPLCDGDVFDLSGAAPYERTKDLEPEHARVQFSVVGANHNFFNSIWTGDDEAGSQDTACQAGSPTSVRLTPEEQRRVGIALMGSFLRRYVGPEPAFDPYVTGAAALPGSACPAHGTCQERVQYSYAAALRQRRVVVSGNEVRSRAGGEVTASGFESFRTCVAVQPTGATADTGDCPAEPTRSPTPQLALEWSAPATLRIALAGDEGDASRFAALTLRAAPVFGDEERNPPGVSQDFDVALVDTAGRSASVAAAAFARGALVPSPGSDERELVLGGVRIGLDRFEGVDLERLAAIELRFGGRTPRGSLQMADVAFQEPRPPRETAPAAPAAASCRRSVRLELRRAISRRLVSARVRAGRRRLRVDRRLRVVVRFGNRPALHVHVTGRLRGGRIVRRTLTLRRCP